MTEKIYNAVFDPLRGLVKAYQDAYEPDQEPLIIAPGKSDIRSLDLEQRLEYINKFLGPDNQNIECPGQKRILPRGFREFIPGTLVRTNE